MRNSFARLDWKSIGAAWTARSLIVLLCLLHGMGIWIGLGGREGLTNHWPLYRHDHPLYQHSALITRDFLKATGTTAGYDPSFMSGYAKSVVFPASSTLPELVIAVFGASRPAFVYKLYVLISAALVPVLVTIAGVLWRARLGAIALTVLLFLIYVWTDFPIDYAALGMLPYLLAIPLGLVATGAFCRYLDRGGVGWWLISSSCMALVVLVHLTSAMIVGPAAALAYVMAIRQGSGERSALSRSRHAGVWAIPVLVLAANAFWWLPGLWLASTKGASDFAFAHPEAVWFRLLKIVCAEKSMQSVLCAAGLTGLVVLGRRDRVAAAGFAGFLGAGFAWGYLAGGFRSLDFLQPGRHTFAFYTGLALASGIGLAELGDRLRDGAGGRLDRWAMLGLVVILIRLTSPELSVALGQLLFRNEPFLSSRPSARLLWVIDRVQRHVPRGERLLYEEGGFKLADVPDPFQGGRFSGLLPHLTGVELIGGPYLHASLTTNFTQFGEDRLFGKQHWDRAHFVRYARLYRPSAIVCWSPWARRFCRSNPDLITVLDDDGDLLIGRINGFGGAAIVGSARVKVVRGVLRVSDAKAGVDGTLVLRYHSVPCLRSDPPVPWEPVFLERDPVPFILLRPTSRTVNFDLHFPPDPGRELVTSSRNR